MFRSMADFFLDRLPLGHSLPITPGTLRMLADMCTVPAWHVEAVHKRMWRRHACIACGWIDRYMPRSASIFEPGCGSGANLLWLASKGFYTLQGSDIDISVLNFSRYLQEELGFAIHTWQDDALHPKKLPEYQDVILSLNWLYHIPGASLNAFLKIYKPCLKRDGIVVIDIIDNSYNKIRNNSFHTNDAKKPLELRRPSEYAFRMSKDEVVEAAAQNGLKVVRSAFINSRPQRTVYILGRKC